MSTIVTLNGIPYQIPSVGETGWGQEVSNYLIALSSGVITLAGGNTTLTNELNTGPTYGIASPYFRSGSDPAADAGVLRLTNTESIMWRNATDTGNLQLSVVGNALYFAGSPVAVGLASPLIAKGDLWAYSTTNARQAVGANGQVLMADSSSPTGLSWQTMGGAGGGSVIGFTFTDANGVAGTVTNPTTTPTLTLSLNAITPTTVTASGAISASNFSGSVNGTFSGTSSGTNTGDQTITLTGDVTGSGTGSFATTLATVPISKGGTGQTTANAALNALLPSQTTHAGEVLTTDGTNSAWVPFPGAGSVTSVSVTANNGITQSVANPTTTPNITLGLGAITPTSVAASGTVTGSNISGTVSGTNTGDQTITLTGDVTGTGTGTFAATLANTGVVAGSYTRANITVDSKGRITAAASEPAQTITLTGDVTGSGTGTFATTLANTGVAAGTYNNVTVNAKGLATAGSNVAYLTGNQNITVSGDATGSGTTAIALTLANTAVAAGSYTFASFTVDSKGRLTSASSGSPVTSVTGAAGTDITVSTTSPTTTPIVSAVLNNTGVVAGTWAANTVDAKGRVTAGANLSGDVTTSGAVATLANTGIAAGTYTRATITVDAKGRITAASSNTAVTSVAAAGTQGVTISGSPITSTGTITVGLGNITPTSVTNTKVGGIGEPYSASSAINGQNENISKFSLASNATIPKPTNIPNSCAFTATYFITQGASPYTVTWFSTIAWAGGTVPSMSVTNGITDLYVLTTFDGGTNWFGTPIQGYV